MPNLLMREIATMLLLVPVLPCQPPAETFSEVAGSVVESATGAGVNGVRVVLLRTELSRKAADKDLFAGGEHAEEAGSEEGLALMMMTSENGSFHFRLRGPATFYLLLLPPTGYVKSAIAIDPSAAYDVKPTKPNNSIVISLARESAITGRILDDQTKEPIRGLSVTPFGFHSTDSGTKTLIPVSQPSISDENGVYRLTGLAPGSYYLELRSPIDARLGVPTDDEESFRDLVTEGYGKSWYPGVSRAEEALPLQLISGFNLEGVNMSTRKMGIASMRGNVVGLHDRNSEVNLALFTAVDRNDLGSRGTLRIASGQIRSGSTFQIDRITPGRYWLIASTTDRQQATAVLDIGEKNQSGVDLILSPGAVLDGHLTLQGSQKREEITPVIGNVKVGLIPLVRLPLADEKPAPVDALGLFTLRNVMADTYRVYVSKVAAGYKVSKVALNGTACPHSIVVIKDDGLYKLEVELVPADGSLIVDAKDNDRPLPHATVLLAPAPVEEIGLYHEMLHKTTSLDGQAVFSQLLPGDYRVLIYPDGVSWDSDPGLKERLANGAEVKIATRQTVRIETHAASKP